jgi:hypothetical protein
MALSLLKAKGYHYKQALQKVTLQDRLICRVFSFIASPAVASAKAGSFPIQFQFSNAIDLFAICQVTWCQKNS